MSAAYDFLPLAGPAAAIAEGVWQLDALPAEECLTIAPDGCCEIILHRAEPPLEHTDAGPRRQPSCFVYGPLGRVLTLQRSGSMRIRAVRLRPWGIGSLVAAPADLRDRAVPLDDAFGAPFAAGLREAADAGSLDRFAACIAGLLEREARAPAASASVRRVCERMAAAPDETVADHAREAACSRRTLSRRFERCVGLGASEYQRILRFHLARNAIRDGEGSLADIALIAGYADQAHMTREFRRFAGVTPVGARVPALPDVFYDPPEK